MPEWIALGRRRGDFGLVIDFRGGRAMARANSAYIDELALETIAESRQGYAPCMVLINLLWNKLYLVNEREGWTEDEYFDFASKRFKELGIETP